jgi:hypothetical protein
MAKDTITIGLTGEVELRDFSEAILNFRILVEGLSQELGVAGEVEWIVQDLQVSSAVATIRGESETIEKVERVVSAYGKVGQALEIGKQPDFSEPVLRATQSLTRILSDRVTAIRFETAEVDATIVARPEVQPLVFTRRTYGTIEGRIQTLTNRKGLRFTLYDTLNDRAVSCYLQESQEDLMREIWGKRAIIEGELTREQRSGRPLVIRKITNINVLPKVEPGNYLRARGIAPRIPGAPLAEEAIRRLRDA